MPLLVLLALLVLCAVGWSLQAIYQQREIAFRHQAEWELQAINQLQTKSVAEWRERRWSDAMALSDDAAYAQAVARWLAQPTDAQAAPVLNRLRILQERARYSAVHLVDLQGRLRLSPSDGAQGASLPAPDLQALQRAIAQAQATPVEPRRDAFFAFPFFGMVAPLYDGVEPVGAVWLVSDVRATLYPLLHDWPTPSKTAESALVLRSGDAVEFLSPVRQRGEDLLPLRLPLRQRDNPAVQAANGERGVLYGRDHRGAEVLAVISTVADSPWLVISKVDVDEAFGDVRTREWLSLSLPIVLALLLAGLVAAYWQWNAWRRERALKTNLERHMRWLENGQRAATIGYFAYEPGRQEFLMSRMASQIFGMSPDRTMTLRQWVQLLEPDERPQVLATHQQAMQQRTPLHTQYRIRRAKDQQLRWIQVWGEYETDAGHDDIARMTGTVQDITARKQTEQELAHYRAALEAQVRLDPLTQVANRRALDEAVAREWHRSLRSGAALSLLMIDVDHFKAYNDQYGHLAGDRCLQQVAQALAESAGREGELVARYGGEEFAVLLPECDAPQAQALAERMLKAVRALDIEHSAAQGRGHVTISIGAACIHPAHAAAATASNRPSATEAAQTLFEQADVALYAAKKAGRDRAVACAAA
ncbi:diguanylate cyclase domain-containing protein [Diaphorobacter sp.]|uniref:GGDEF domain-containing protein n=1 Tax=Diaphorobacter sp. TaxID=1934310 RepID=UPI003D0FEB14